MSAVDPGQASELQQTAGQAPAGATTTEKPDGETPEQKAARLERELAETRKEAAGYRTKLRAEEAAKEEAARKAAEEQGEFKQLYEQAQQQLAELEAARTKAERAQLLARIATEAGLDATLAERLRGEDEAALRADAKALAERLKPAAPTDAGSPANGARSQQQQLPAFDPKNPPRLSDPANWKR